MELVFAVVIAVLCIVAKVIGRATRPGSTRGASTLRNRDNVPVPTTWTPDVPVPVPRDDLRAAIPSR